MGDKALDAFSVREAKEGRRVFVRAGSAYQHDDGSVSVFLDVLPLDGKLRLQPRGASLPLGAERTPMPFHAEYLVEDDGHGRAMVGGRRLAFGGKGLRVGDLWAEGPQPQAQLNVGARVIAELRDGVDFATLIRVLAPVEATP